MSHPTDPYLIVTPEDVFSSYPAMAEPELWKWCRAASAWMERELQRKVKRRTHTLEQHRGGRDLYLRLDNPPVWGVDAIDLDGEAVDVDTITIHDPFTALLYRSEGWGDDPEYMQPPETLTPFFQARRREFDEFELEYATGDTGGSIVKVTYDGGFDETENGGELAEIWSATVAKVADMIDRKTGGSLTSETIGSYSYTRSSGNGQGARFAPSTPWAEVVEHYRLGGER